MTSASMANLRQDASTLLYQMPEESLQALVSIMKSMAGQSAQQKPKRKFGVAAGKFVCPDDIDADNATIAEMFGVKE